MKSKIVITLESESTYLNDFAESMLEHCKSEIDLWSLENETINLPILPDLKVSGEVTQC